MNLADTIHKVAFRWTPAFGPHNDVHPRAGESKEDRAQRSLAHIEEVLQTRQRWRHRARVLALVLVPLVLMMFARQARGAFA